jgi:hypothetical protein
MDKISMSERAVSRKKPSGRAELIFIAVAIIVWMVVGIILTWLLTDFNRNLAPDVPDVHPSVIFSSFLLFALFVWRISLNPRRNSSAR